MKPGSVAVGYVFDVEPSMSWHLSMMQLVDWDRAKFDPNPHFDRSRFIPQYSLGQKCGTDALAAARNDVVRRFLKTEAEWLFWVDTDMGFEPDVIDKLLSVADPVTAPIVGALCFMQSHTAQDGMGGFRCYPQVTIFDWHDAFDGAQRYLQSRRVYPVNSLVQCDGTGSACVVVHRTVFEKIKKEHGPHWYTRMTNDSTGALVGEDLSFCIRAENNVHVYTAAKTTHLKHLWLGEEDFWQAYLAPPADEEVAVIVPVMQRPQNAAPFMKSLRATTGLATVYAVCDDDDVQTENAWRMAGATVISAQRGHTFAQKANWGYEVTDKPWLFLCGDDVHFHPAWYDQALHVAKTEDVSVVGTDDLGNLEVRRGNHATHPLIRRSYVDEQGASWDGPKVLASEEYRHWYVDNEWTTVAKQRGQFGFALGSVVEHLHPLWGKSQMDETYKKGQFHRDRDRRTWEKRWAANR